MTAPSAPSVPHWTLASAVCTGCRRAVPRHALDTTGRCPECAPDDMLPTILALLIVAFSALDHAVLAERADAAREAWIAAMEAEAVPAALPWSGGWDEADALVPEEVA